MLHMFRSGHNVSNLPVYECTQFSNSSRVTFFWPLCAMPLNDIVDNQSSVTLLLSEIETVKF